MRCSECKRKLSKQVVKIAKSLGARRVMGSCCCPNFKFMTDGTQFLKAIKKVNQKHGKTFKN